MRATDWGAHHHIIVPTRTILNIFSFKSVPRLGSDSLRGPALFLLGTVDPSTLRPFRPRSEGGNDTQPRRNDRRGPGAPGRSGATRNAAGKMVRVTREGLAKMHERQSERLQDAVREAQAAEARRQERLDLVTHGGGRAHLERRFREERCADARRIRRIVEDNDHLLRAYAKELKQQEQASGRSPPPAPAPAPPRRGGPLRRAEPARSLRDATAAQVAFYREAFGRLGEDRGRREAARRLRRGRQAATCRRLAHVAAHARAGASSRAAPRPGGPRQPRDGAERRRTLLRQQRALLEQLHEATSKEEALIAAGVRRTRPATPSTVSAASYATFGSRSSVGSASTRRGVPRLW